jgi:hypothetical protein
VDDTLVRAMARFGLEAQISKLQEECLEAALAVSRVELDRPDAWESLLEEIADVEILIDQMRIVFAERINAYRSLKIARLKETLDALP